MRSIVFALGFVLVASSAHSQAVTCKDGTPGKAGKGACSHHGGVAPAKQVIPQGSPKAVTVPSIPTGATAQCRDKTYSMSAHRRGTCSRHGGVAQWLRKVAP